MSLVEDVERELAKRRPAPERTRKAVAKITDDRRIEWLTTWVIFGLGISLVFPGNTLETTRVFATLNDALGPQGEFYMALLMLAVALAKGAALTINGVRGRPTSLVRLATAALGAGLFAALSYTVALPWLLGEMPAPNLGMLTYAALAGADYTSAVRAARDAWICRRDR